MESSSSTPVLDPNVAAATGPRPSDVVQTAWASAAVAAVCDPPAPPTAPRVATGDRPPQRGHWFEMGSGQELFESSPCGILLATPLGRVVDANPAFLAITGRAWREVAGTRVNRALGISSSGSLLPSTPMRAGGAVQVERSCRHHSGRTLELELTVIPLPDAHCSTIEVLAIHVVDITARREAERRIVSTDDE
ncbi:MAG: PAS domain-containing protein [Acidimicrobiales bacterium]